jgi:hypothetical protein
MKPEVKEVPELIRLDAEIKRLHGRISRLEAMLHMALRQGGPGWVNQVVRIGTDLSVLLDKVTGVVHEFNSIKARWQRGRSQGKA